MTRLSRGVFAFLVATGLTVSAPLLSVRGHADEACFGSPVGIHGTDGNDTIEGTSGNDVIDGEEGNDTINGGAGDDKICGDEGDDVIEGGPGYDRCDGGPGRDVARNCEETLNIP